MTQQQETALSGIRSTGSLHLGNYFGALRNFVRLQEILLTLLCCLNVSCTKWGGSENKRLMQQAQLFVELMLDSALILLDEVNTVSLSDAEKAEYTLLRVQARTNADRDLTTDTEIFQAWEYFIQKNNTEKATLAGFYAAWVAKARKDAALEMDCYLKTIPFAEKTNNQLLLGKIYYNMGYLDYVCNYNRRALSLANSDSEKAYIYMNMAHVYLKKDILDSAKYYLNRAEPLYGQSVDIYTLASLTHLRYQIEKAGENYQKALEYFEIYAQYLEEITEKRDQQVLMELNKKYDSIVLENELYRINSRWWKTVGILGSVILGLAMAVFITKNENKRKKLALERTEREKQETELKLEILQNLYTRHNNVIKTKVLNKLGIIKGIAFFFRRIDEKKEMTYKKMENLIDELISEYPSEKIIQIANEVYPGLTGQLKSRFQDANLSDRELTICCKSICGFTNNEIAVFIDRKKSLKAVENWKTTIRKKLAIHHYDDIGKALLDSLKLNETSENL